MKAILPIVAIAQTLFTTGVVGLVAYRRMAPRQEAKAAAKADAPKAAADKGGEHGKQGAHAAGAKEEGDHGGPDVLAALLSGNARFVEGKRAEHALTEERKKLASGQHPGAMVLSCSDSRVPPELVFDQSLGDLFVVRTAGNVADAIALGSLEYAAEHLHSKVLVVLGHEKCGAVTAAAKGGELPTDNLKALVAAIEPAVAPLKASAQGDELVHKGVHANVEASAKHLVASSPILRELAEKKELRIVHAVYDLDSGKVETW